MSQEIKYYQKWKKCGKPECRFCRDSGKGHGPYWFARINGKETYFGTQAPFEMQSQTVGRSHQSLFVGREDELAELQNRLAMVGHRDQAQVNKRPKNAIPTISATLETPFELLTGEIGIGKTRLVEEVARLALRQNWEVAWGRAYAQEGNIPYRPWIEILRTVLSQKTWSPKGIQQFERYWPILVSLLPDLPDILAQTLQVEALPSPEREPLLLWEAVYQTFLAASAERPHLIVLDDLQWADSSSRDLLAYLVRRMRSSPVLFLGTCRDSELGVSHPLRSLLADLQREGCLVVRSIPQLNDDHIRALLADLPLPVVHTICERAGGNPFFAEELARAFSMVPEREPSQGTLPYSINVLLQKRFSKLSSPCQKLLTKAALLGNTFNYSLLYTLEQATTSNGSYPDEKEILTGFDEAIDEAVRDGVLTETRAGKQITYHFWHPLFVEMLNKQTSATLQAHYHRKIAELLQGQFREKGELEAATIVHHLVLGLGEEDSIAYYAQIAGNRAYQLSAYPEAEKYFQLALDSMHKHAEESSLGKPTPEWQRREAELLEFLGECARFQGKYEDAQRWYESALAVWANRAFSTPEEKQQTAQVQCLLSCEAGVTWYSRGRVELASEYYKRSEIMLREAGIKAGPAWAYLRYRQSYAFWRRGAYEEALTLASEALRLQEHSDFHQPQQPETSLSPATLRTLTGDPINSGRMHQLFGLISNGMGRYQETIEHWNAAHAIFEQYDSKRDLAVVCCNLGDVHLRKADYSSAQVMLQQALMLAEQIGEIPLAGVVLGNLGILALRQGSLTEAETWLKRGVKCAEQANNTIHRSTLHAYLAITLLEEEHLSGAKASVYCALSLARTLHIIPGLGVALVALGHLRFVQATITRPKKETPISPQTKKKLLIQATRTLCHVLALGEIESETQVEARLLLAQVKETLGDHAQAQELAAQAAKEAEQYQLTWLVARAHSILASSLASQGQQEQAVVHYQQALQMLHTTGMRLEYDRTLKVYKGTLEATLQEMKRGGQAIL